MPVRIQGTQTLTQIKKTVSNTKVTHRAVERSIVGVCMRNRIPNIQIRRGSGNCGRRKRNHYTGKVTSQGRLIIDGLEESLNGGREMTLMVVEDAHQQDRSMMDANGRMMMIKIRKMTSALQ